MALTFLESYSGARLTAARNPVVQTGVKTFQCTLVDLQFHSKIRSFIAELSNPPLQNLGKIPRSLIDPFPSLQIDKYFSQKIFKIIIIFQKNRYFENKLLLSFLNYQYQT